MGKVKYVTIGRLQSYIVTSFAIALKMRMEIAIVSWAITVLKKNWLNYVTKSDAYSNNPGGLRGAGLRVRTALMQSDISIMATFYSKDE